MTLLHTLYSLFIFINIYFFIVTFFRVFIGRQETLTSGGLLKQSLRKDHYFFMFQSIIILLLNQALCCHNANVCWMSRENEKSVLLLPHLCTC